MGISGCLLRTHRCESILVSQEPSYRDAGAPLHGGQHISFARAGMDDALFSDICVRSRLNPVRKRPNQPESQLLYFSLVTLSTIGYGDIVPLSGEVRIVSA